MKKILFRSDLVWWAMLAAWLVLIVVSLAIYIGAVS